MKLQPPLEDLLPRVMLVRWEKLPRSPFKGPVTTVMTVSKETGVLCYLEANDGSWWMARLALPPGFTVKIPQDSIEEWP